MDPFVGAVQVVLQVVGALMSEVTGSRRTEILPKTTDPAQQHRRQLLGRSIASLLMGVSRADGKLGNDEMERVLRILRRQVGFDETQAQAALKALREADRSAIALEVAAAECRTQLNDSERLLLLDALYAVAMADGEVHRAEQASIRRLGPLLGLSPETQRSSLARNRGTAALCYELLGVHPGATDEEVRAAYVRNSGLLQPETLEPLGADVFQSTQERRAQIERAWQELRRLRGL